MKPEALYEVERGLKLSAFDITAASAVRAAWHHATRRFFETYDYFVVPTAQVFPFDVGTDVAEGNRRAGDADLSRVDARRGSHHDGGQPGAGRAGGLQRHRAADGHPDRRAEPWRLRVLQLGHAYDLATGWPERRPPPMLGDAR